MKLFAVCDRAGVIFLTSAEIHGLLTIAQGEAPALADVISAISRHGYQGEWLVPGVPEAANGDAAVDAMIAFKREVERRLAPEAQQ
jgi:hypothetical protein